MVVQCDGMSSCDPEWSGQCPRCSRSRDNKFTHQLGLVYYVLHI